MARLLNQKEFAQLCGISPQAINKAVRQERIHLTRKKVDPRHPTNRHFLETVKNRAAGSPLPAPAAGGEQTPGPGQELEQAPGAPAGGEQSGAPAPRAPAVPQPLPPAGPKTNRRRGNGGRATNGLTDSVLSQLDFSAIDQSQDGKLYKGQVDVLKAVEQTKGLQYKNENLRNTLIDRNLVAQYFAQLYSVQTTELLTLGEKLSPEIAARFGLDDENAILDVGKFIQKEVSNVLEHIEMIITKFLKSFPVEEN